MKDILVPSTFAAGPGFYGADQGHALDVVGCLELMGRKDIGIRSFFLPGPG
jgi:hypothetical protein